MRRNPKPDKLILLENRSNDMESTIKHLLYDYIPKKRKKTLMDESHRSLDYIQHALTKSVYELELRRILSYHRPWKDNILPFIDGNPGALRVLVELDTFNFIRASSEELLAWIIALGIHGSKIWVLYKDLCNQDYSYLEDLFMRWKRDNVSTYRVLEKIDKNDKPRLRNIKDFEE